MAGALAAVCALILAGCTGDSGPYASAEAGTPIAVHASPWASAAAEARVLADRILQGESDDLLLDGGRQRALGYEIKRALALIRRSDPAMAEICARDWYGREIILQLEGVLRDAVVDLWSDGGASTLPRTEHAAFDSLNETLGLRAVMVFSRSGSVVLHLGERMNIPAAVKAYEARDGVVYAEPNYLLVDGSDIAAAKSDGTWLVAFRKAWGDCPAGCIDQEIAFFTVADGEVERIEPVQARAMDPFATLLANRGWR